jgi:hypothetical protein
VRNCAAASGAQRVRLTAGNRLLKTFSIVKERRRCGGLNVAQLEADYSAPFLAGLRIVGAAGDRIPPLAIGRGLNANCEAASPLCLGFWRSGGELGEFGFKVANDALEVVDTAAEMEGAVDGMIADCVERLSKMDRHLLRCFDAEADFVAADFDNNDLNVVVDDDRFVFLTGEDEHGAPLVR